MKANVRHILLFIGFLCVTGSTWSQLPVTEPDQVEYPEWLYERRIKELDSNTPIRLEYNQQVKAYIQVYTVKRREHLSRIIGRAEYYFPLFEEHLSRYNLPLELKYLAIVESALDPLARSSSGAMGLWQFLYQASRMFDLKVDSYMDERCDPLKSTIAACQYLEYLYRNLNDWQLALAAYNGGLGEIQKAIERSGGITNYWELQPYLPKAVKGYVPAFIAVNYVMNHYKNHDVEATPHFIRYEEVDTVYINKGLTFQQVSQAAGVELELVKRLNPAFTKDYFPANNLPIRIFLPAKNIPTFIQEEPDLAPSNGPLISHIPTGDKQNRQAIIHIVQKGEFFHRIAMLYKCRIKDILHWNNLTSRNLLIGQELKVWAPMPENHFFLVPSIHELPAHTPEPTTLTISDFANQ
jgi:membrane-bound lytic murein transglycosylase D